jgi:hypothetical protein
VEKSTVCDISVHQRLLAVDFNHRITSPISFLTSARCAV